MTVSRTDGATGSRWKESVALPSGLAASWVGPGPADGVCFGSEDGRLWGTDAEGRALFVNPSPGMSDEAINGVAFQSSWMAVSTRAGMRFLADSPPRYQLFTKGAHEVVGAGGTFFAPLGQLGLLTATPNTDGGLVCRVHQELRDDAAYFYGVCPLRSGAVACAIRKRGIAAAIFRETSLTGFSTMAVDGLDIICLCPLDSDEHPAATAALGIDGTLVFFRDVVSELEPITVRYEGLTGTSYRVLSARGWLFVLTSRGLHIIGDLVGRVLAGDDSDGETPKLTLPMEAVDMNLVGDRWLFVILADGVLRLDVHRLDEMKPTPARLHRHFPIWTHTSAELHSVAG